MRSAIVSVAFAALAAAAPVVEKRQSSNIDGVILNYALTLEHLENAFYQLALQTFSQADFKAVGLDNVFYKNLQEISSDEKTHVSFLTTALGAAGVPAVVPNDYSFGFTTIPQFLAIANVLEGVGVSAYLGAAASITNKAYLTAAGSILTVESRHSAYLRSKQSPQLSPFPAAFDIPLDFDQVYSLAAPFITKNNNPTIPLPVVAFPSIAVAPAAVHKIGDVLSLTVAKSVNATGAYFVTYPGGPIQATLTGSGSSYKVTVPAGAQAGQAYLILTTDGKAPTDDTTAAGPAVFEIADNQYGVTPDPVLCSTSTGYHHATKTEHATHTATSTTCTESAKATKNWS